MNFIERIKQGHKYFVETRRDYVDYVNPSFGEYALNYIQFMWYVIWYHPKI